MFDTKINTLKMHPFIELLYQYYYRLGNLDSRRDWGHARDYVEGMWQILQQQTPDDFVLSTGVMHSVRQFVEMAFNHVNVKIVWEGKDVDEVGKDEVSDLKFPQTSNFEFIII